MRTVYFYYHYYYKLQIVFRCGHEINFEVRGCNKKRYYLQYISVIKSFAMQYKFFSLCGQTFLFFLFQAWTFHNTATFVNGLFYTNSLVSVCVCVNRFYLKNACRILFKNDVRKPNKTMCKKIFKKMKTQFLKAKEISFNRCKYTEYLLQLLSI